MPITHMCRDQAGKGVLPLWRISRALSHCFSISEKQASINSLLASADWPERDRPFTRRNWRVRFWCSRLACRRCFCNVFFRSRRTILR